MKSIKFLFALIALIMSFSTCTENDPDVVAPEEEEGIPEATPVGTPLGEMVTKQIGPEGGSISSIDGKMDLMIPPGALNATTAITVQPVTNFAPGGVENAYELLPDGQKFSIPVTLTFHHIDTVQGATWPEMGIAFQDVNGFWHRAENIVSDSVSKTISATSLHFTVWSPYEDMTITPRYNHIRVNKSVDLELIVVGATGDDLMLITKKPVGVVWKVYGITNGNEKVGKISGIGNGKNTKKMRVTYTAPTKDPHLIYLPIRAYMKDKNGTTHQTMAIIHIVGDDLHYTLEIKVRGGLTSTFWYDRATLNVDVVNDIVTVSSIENFPPQPTKVSENYNGCVVTVEAGTIGQMNIDKVKGKLTHGGEILYLEFIHKDTRDFGTYEMKCPGVDALTVKGDLNSGWPYSEGFPAQNAVATNGLSSNGAYWAQLKPR
jgi:hypothetical protein